MAFVLPSKAEVGALDPEIAGEGQRVITSEGDVVNFTPAPVKAVVPDLSGVKSIRHYFQARPFRVWPSWLYNHATGEDRLVKNADEAAELGVCYRQATIEERGKYGREFVWDWKDDSQWRPQPKGAKAFDPANPGTGKTFMPPAANSTDMVSAVAGKVAEALSAAGGPQKPANIDQADWREFLQFKAWKEAQAMLPPGAEETPAPTTEAGEAVPDAANALESALATAAGDGADEHEAPAADKRRRKSAA